MQQKRCLVVLFFIATLICNTTSAMELINPNHKQFYDDFFATNQKLAWSKAAQVAAEGFRISQMQSKNKNIIQIATLLSAFASAILLGTKILGISQDKKLTYDKEPLLWLYPIASMSRTFFDLCKSLYLCKKATIIAENNKHHDEKAIIPASAKQIILALLALEGGCSVYQHKALSNSKNNLIKLVQSRTDEESAHSAFDIFDSGIAFVGTKASSFILWVIRHIYEAKYLNTSRFVAPMQETSNTQEAFSFEQNEESITNIEDYDLEEWS